MWKRTSSHNDPKRFGRIHDVILLYVKSAGAKFNVLRRPLDPEYVKKVYTRVDEKGRRYRLDNISAPGGRGPIYEWGGVTQAWRYTRENMEQLYREGRIKLYPDGRAMINAYVRYLDENEGQPIQDWWDDIGVIAAPAKERLGYPTQKPQARLERIVQASSNEGEVVLDPFCGCGTTIAAAQQLGRRWIGIDITYLAIDLIRKRLLHTYGSEIEKTYSTKGIPTDLEGARALFRENHFEFERWAVSQVNGQPKDRPGGDLGIDGRIRFHADQKRIGQVIVSVKGGEQLNPGMIRDLAGTVGRERAEMGILLSLEKPTPGMSGEASKSGTYTSPLTGQSYPRLQLFTVADHFEGRAPKMPPAILPYFKAKEWGGEQSQLQLVAERAAPYRKNSN